MYVFNGPTFFAREWTRVLVHGVVCRCRSWATLDIALLRHILWMAA